MQNILLQANAGGGGMSFIVMMVIIFVIMWLFMIRPQQKKQKEVMKFQNSLEAGQDVITGGGIHGKVKGVDINAGTVDVEIAKGVVITVEKNSIYRDSASQPQTQK
ncbi:MAG: preprotein translocase subunit YajC [Prevotella sp.]|nr:preprotein translocase subunit YajC [Candidatus Equicola stercoris]